MENVNKIKSLLDTSNKIHYAFSEFDRYAQNKKHYDKTGFGFNVDDRFAAHKGLVIRVDSYMGTYGDSGCGRVISLDDEIFNSHLLKVLKKDFKEIMLKVADSIKTEASDLKEKAIKEVENQKELLETLS